MDVTAADLDVYEDDVLQKVDTFQEAVDPVSIVLDSIPKAADDDIPVRRLEAARKMGREHDLRDPVADFVARGDGGNQIMAAEDLANSLEGVFIKRVGVNVDRRRARRRRGRRRCRVGAATSCARHCARSRRP